MIALKVLRLGEGRGGREYLKSVSKRTSGEGGLKLINLERTHFLNGPHPKIVGFLYFSENPLKMMNVSYFIWQALYYRKTAWLTTKVNFKIYDVTNWNTENYNKDIPKYPKHIWGYWHIKEIGEEPILILEESLVPNCDHFHILRLVIMLLQIFLAPQVKRSAIIGTKHGIYKLLHELPIDFRLWILENLERSGKSQKFIEL